jgi:hypothetical protein
MVRRRKSRRSAYQAQPAPEGVVVGRFREGSRVLPVRSDGHIVLPFEEFFSHLLLAGTTGSGKSETALRIAYELARKTDYRVFILDPKGDRELAERFVALMRAAGREPRVFPQESFDVWRGDADAIIERVLSAIDYPDKGGATYYRDIAEVVVQLACRFKSGPPRSSGELLHRLDYTSLVEQHGEHHRAVATLDMTKVNETRVRFQALFGRIGEKLDGSWAWEDADSGYLLLNSLSGKISTGSVARMLFTDYANYFASDRKSRDSRVWLCLDEFASVASSSTIGDTMRQARSFEAGVAVITQTVSGLGSEAQLDDVMGNVGTVILHRMPRSDELAHLAGTRERLGFSHHYDPLGNLTGIAHRDEEVQRVDSRKVRAMSSGMVWMIREGSAARVMVERAPKVEDHDLYELPEVEETEVLPDEVKTGGSQRREKFEDELRKRGGRKIKRDE